MFDSGARLYHTGSVASTQVASTAPPSGNTGALFTEGVIKGAAIDPRVPLKNRVLIDWISWTYPEGVSPFEVCRRLGEFFQPLDYGRYGYASGFQRGFLNVYYDGSERGMGVHVEASGKGCRQLETEGIVTDWPRFLLALIEEGCSFSRLDVAFDDVEGLFSIEDVMTAYRLGHVVTRFRNKPKVMFDLAREGQVDGGKSLTFGHVSSDTQLQFYDKAAQLGIEGASWNRCEIRFREKLRATAVVLEMCYAGVAFVAGVVRGYLEVKEPSADTNRTRWSPAAWWDRLMNGAALMTLSMPGVVRTVEKAHRWLRKQVAPAIAMFKDALPLIFADLLEEGRVRLTPWHHEMMRLIALGGDSAESAWRLGREGDWASSAV
jgi:phage replication initiation protein